MVAMPWMFAWIGLGAACGACLRWVLGLQLNAYLSVLPLGTLLANWLGAFLMGLAMAGFGAWPEMSPALKSALTTGFLGGLTTFSTFSAEAVMLLQSGQYAAFLLHMGLHVIGSLLLTLAGFWLANLCFAV